MSYSCEKKIHHAFGGLFLLDTKRNCCLIPAAPNPPSIHSAPEAVEASPPQLLPAHPRQGPARPLRGPRGRLSRRPRPQRNLVTRTSCLRRQPSSVRCRVLVSATLSTCSSISQELSSHSIQTFWLVYVLKYVGTFSQISFTKFGFFLRVKKQTNCVRKNPRDF